MSASFAAVASLNSAAADCFAAQAAGFSPDEAAAGLLAADKLRDLFLSAVPVKPALAAAAGEAAPPWRMSQGSVSELLSEVGLLELYGETFAEYGLTRAEQLSGGGAEAMEATLRELGVTRDHRERLLVLALSPRPCGSSGRAFSREFLAACRPAHSAAMGAENIGPLLYALLRFVKPQHVVEARHGRRRARQTGARTSPRPPWWGDVPFGRATRACGRRVPRRPPALLPALVSRRRMWPQRRLPHTHPRLLQPTRRPPAPTGGRRVHVALAAAGAE
jgi:hypothetical protein